MKATNSNKQLSQNLIVQKYGGTSLDSIEKIKGIAQKIAALKKQGSDIIVVVSAMGRTTNQLITLAREITSEPSRRELDMLLTAGERISMALLAIALNDIGVEAISFTGSQSGIITDTAHTNARIVEIRSFRVEDEIKRGKVVIVAGFQGVSLNKEVTTLGRGGSDTTAVALAASLNAKVCEILTDVDGIYTADPKLVPWAKKISFLSYDEMLEMANLGARVLHRRSVELARKYRVKLHVKSSYKNSSGTIIMESDKNMENVIIRGIVHNKNIVKITFTGVKDTSNTPLKILEKFYKNRLHILLFVQSPYKNKKHTITFAIPLDELQKFNLSFENMLNEIEAEKVEIERNVATVSVVGEGISTSSEAYFQIFSILFQANVKIHLISTSNLMITFLIEESDIEKAVKALHANLIEGI